MASNSSAMPNSAAVQIKCEIRDFRLDEAMLNEFFIVNESAKAIRVERARSLRLLQRFSARNNRNSDSYRARRSFWGTSKSLPAPSNNCKRENSRKVIILNYLT